MIKLGKMHPSVRATFFGGSREYSKRGKILPEPLANLSKT